MQPIVLRNLIQKVRQDQIQFYKRNYIDKLGSFFLLQILINSSILILKRSYDKNLDSFKESSVKFVIMNNSTKTKRKDEFTLILYGQWYSLFTLVDPTSGLWAIKFLQKAVQVTIHTQYYQFIIFKGFYSLPHKVLLSRKFMGLLFYCLLKKSGTLFEVSTTHLIALI